MKRQYSTLYFSREEETARYSTVIIKLVGISNNSQVYLCGYFIWKLDVPIIFTSILDTLGLASKKMQRRGTLINDDWWRLAKNGHVA